MREAAKELFANAAFVFAILSIHFFCKNYPNVFNVILATIVLVNWMRLDEAKTKLNSINLILSRHTEPHGLDEWQTSFSEAIEYELLSPRDETGKQASAFVSLLALILLGKTAFLLVCVFVVSIATHTTCSKLEKIRTRTLHYGGESEPNGQ